MPITIAPSDSYLALIREFPLRRLRSDEDLVAAIAIVDRLIVKNELDAGESDYLDVLSDMIHAYEAATDPIPEVAPADMLRYLLETHGITQAQLAEQTGLATTTISEILNGRRSCSAKTRKALAERFNVEPSVFA